MRRCRGAGLAGLAAVLLGAWGWRRWMGAGAVPGVFPREPTATSSLSFFSVSFLLPASHHPSSPFPNPLSPLFLFPLFLYHLCQCEPTSMHACFSMHPLLPLCIQQFLLP